MARSVRWRGAAERSPAVSNANLSSRWALICSTDRTPILAAASSIASGRPSSARQMSVTAMALSGPTAKPGRTAAARSANRRTASSWCTAGTPSPVPGGGGTASGGTRQTVSAARRSGSRLVISSRRPGELTSSRPATLAQASIKCSQLSRASSIRRDRSTSASVSSSGRPGSSLTPMTAASREITRSGCRRSASSTKQAPSRNSACMDPSRRNASLVFPMPPGPASVSARLEYTSRRSSSSSRSRPIKLFGSSGRCG